MNQYGGWRDGGDGVDEEGLDGEAEDDDPERIGIEEEAGTREEEGGGRGAQSNSNGCPTG